MEGRRTTSLFGLIWKESAWRSGPMDPTVADTIQREEHLNSVLRFPLHEGIASRSAAHISASGAVMSPGTAALDTELELIREFHDSLTVNSTDVAIVAAAYEKCGENCLA